MRRGPRVALERRWVVGLAAAGLAYAYAAAFTHPFTVPADVITAVPLVAAALGTAWWVGTKRRSPAGGPAPDGLGDTDRSRRWMIWWGPVLAVLAWELYCFVSLPRRQHPTLSALIDILDSSRTGKTIGFALWLVLGWFLVTR